MNWGMDMRKIRGSAKDIARADVIIQNGVVVKNRWGPANNLPCGLPDGLYVLRPLDTPPAAK